jgi:hypothetical protein
MRRVIAGAAIVVLGLVVSAAAPAEDDPFAGLNRNSLDWAPLGGGKNMLKPWEGRNEQWIRVYNEAEDYNDCWNLPEHPGSAWCEKASKIPPDSLFEIDSPGEREKFQIIAPTRSFSHELWAILVKQLPELKNTGDAALWTSVEPAKPWDKYAIASDAIPSGWRTKLLKEGATSEDEAQEPEREQANHQQAAQWLQQVESRKQEAQQEAERKQREAQEELAREQQAAQEEAERQRQAAQEEAERQRHAAQLEEQRNQQRLRAATIREDDLWVSGVTVYHVPASEVKVGDDVPLDAIFRGYDQFQVTIENTSKKTLRAFRVEVVLKECPGDTWLSRYSPIYPHGHGYLRNGGQTTEDACATVGDVFVNYSLDIPPGQQRTFSV